MIEVFVNNASGSVSFICLNSKTNFELEDPVGVLILLKDVSFNTFRMRGNVCDSEWVLFRDFIFKMSVSLTWDV